MRPLPPLCLLLILAACGGAEAPPAAKPTPAAAATPAKPELLDRSATALVATRETIDGVGLTIDLPAGLKREDKAAERWINWTFTDGNPFMEPSITVKRLDALGAVKDLDALVRRAGMPTQDKPPLVVSKQETLADGTLLVISERADGQFFKVTTQSGSDDKIFSCTILQRTGTGKPDDVAVPSFPATKAWAEKICTSLKLE